MYRATPLQAFWRVTSAQRGFSLLETMVAIGLLASVGIAALAWVQSSQQLLIASRNAERERDLTHVVLAEIKQIDLAKAPTGRRNFGDWDLQYASVPISNERTVKALVGQRLFRAQLLKVTATVRYGRQGEIEAGEFPISFEQVAFK